MSLSNYPAASGKPADDPRCGLSCPRSRESGEWEDTLHSLFLSISYEPKSPFKLWRADRVLTRESFFDMIPNLPGVLSDRLFSAFDLDNSGAIDFNEFLEGLHALGETTEKKLAFLHRMYDLNGDGFVSKQELLMMLTHMNGSQDQQSLFNDPLTPANHEPGGAGSEGAGGEGGSSGGGGGSPGSGGGGSPSGGGSPGGGGLEGCNSGAYLENLIHDFLPDDSSVLDFPSFAKLLQSEPHLRRMLESFCLNTMPKFLPFYSRCHGTKTLSGADSMAEATPMLSRDKAAASCNKTYVKTLAPTDQIWALSQPYEFCGWLNLRGVIHFAVLKDKYLLLYKSPSDCIPSKAICLVGAKCNFGHGLHSLLWRRKTPSDDSVDVLVIDQNYLNSPGSYRQYRYYFTLTLTRGRNKIKLGTNSCRDCLRWRRVIKDILVRKLSEFHEHYLLKNALGRGRFSTVFAAQHRLTGQKVAVKIMQRPNRSGHISKGAITVDSHSELRLVKKHRNCLRCDAPHTCVHSLFRRISCKTKLIDCESNDLRDLQRTEISVLRLLNHANLVKLLDVYYSYDFIYIIMPWSSAGDLKSLLDALLCVNRVLLHTYAERQESKSKSHPDFSAVKYIWIPDQVCQTLLRGILRGLSYLHSKLRNVVHRDIKPDNILLDLQIDDLVNDVLQLAESKKRKKALADINRPAPPKISLSTPPEELAHRGVGSTGVPSMTSKQPDAAGPAAEYLAIEASDMSSALDTIDQYSMDTPQQQHQFEQSDQPISSHCLLGSLDNDVELQSVQRPFGDREEHMNAWLFLHVLLWMFRDRRESDFLDLITPPAEHSSSLPVILFEQLTTEDLVGLITKHTHPRITDFGLSKILAPLEPRHREGQLSSSASPSSGRLSTHANEPMGTEAYAAPEVRSGLGYTTSADIWSLGVVAYQTISGGYFPSADGEAQCPGSATFAGMQCHNFNHFDLHFVPRGIWEGVPELAKNFIKTVLQVNAQKRPTAEECLKHLWLNQHHQQQQQLQR